MIKCDHCGWGFPDHRPDASCAIKECPHMRRRALDAGIDRLDKIAAEKGEGDEFFAEMARQVAEFEKL